MQESHSFDCGSFFIEFTGKGVIMLNEQNQKKSRTQRLVLSGVIGGIYAALTLMVYPLSYGPIQVRISEALTVLPLFFGEAVIGLSVGCLVANFFGNGVLDVVFGTLATLIAGVLTMASGRIKDARVRVVVGIIPPIVVNALIVPLTFLALTELKEAYLINVLTVGAGQAVVLTVLGIPLAVAMQKNKFLSSLSQK